MSLGNEWLDIESILENKSEQGKSNPQLVLISLDVQRLARRGIPSQHRALVNAPFVDTYDKAWWYLSGAKKRASQSDRSYHDLCGDRSRLRMKPVDNLSRALNRYRPGQQITPAMMQIMQIFMRVMQDEERAFWIMISLLDDLLPPEFFDGDGFAARIDALVVIDWFSKSRDLRRPGDDLPIVKSWLMTLFTDILPKEVRV